MQPIKMTDLNLANQRVLIRQDLNVPVKDGQVTSDARIRASLPTIQQAVAAGAKVILMSHLGRPTEGEFAQEFSLQPVASHLSELLGKEVKLISQNEAQEAVNQLAAGEVILLDNVRFNAGEKANSDELAQAYASLCDIFVMDAFGTAHRAQASTHGVAKFAPVACAGPLLSAELEALAKALETPAKPLVAIVGGSKVSTKLEVLNALGEKCDHIIVGGGIANTFLAAAGLPVGKSLYEADLVETAKQLMAKANFPLPSDVVVATEFSDTAEATIKLAEEVSADEMILDLGPNSAVALSLLLKDAGTILWNGPVGVFEIQQFSSGTKVLAKAIADSAGFSIAGGGDTLAAIDKFNLADQVSYISTGGGAFLEFVEGKTLPAVEILQQRAKN